AGDEPAGARLPVAPDRTPRTVRRRGALELADGLDQDGGLAAAGLADEEHIGLLARQPLDELADLPVAFVRPRELASQVRVAERLGHALQARRDRLTLTVRRPTADIDVDPVELHLRGRKEAGQRLRRQRFESLLDVMDHEVADGS